MPLSLRDLATGDKERGIEIDVPTLQQRLDCPVVPVVASIGEGIAALKASILAAVRGGRHSEEVTPFVTELPPYHLPTLKGILLRSRTNPKPMSWRADMTDEQLPAPSPDEGEQALDMVATIGEGLATIRANLSDAMRSWLDPLGLNIVDAGPRTWIPRKNWDDSSHLYVATQEVPVQVFHHHSPIFA